MALQDAEDAVAYQLRVNLTCMHAEHTDSASFDALVLLGADGGSQVGVLIGCGQAGLLCPAGLLIEASPSPLFCKMQPPFLNSPFAEPAFSELDFCRTRLFLNWAFAELGFCRTGLF